MMGRTATVLVLSVFLAGSASADSPLGGMPPDIAAIMKKLASGQNVSPADQAKIENWENGVTASGDGAVESGPTSSGSSTGGSHQTAAKPGGAGCQKPANSRAGYHAKNLDRCQKH